MILDPSLAKSPEPRHVNDLESLYDLNLSNVDSALPLPKSGAKFSFGNQSRKQVASMTIDRFGLVRFGEESSIGRCPLGYLQESFKIKQRL